MCGENCKYTSNSGRVCLFSSCSVLVFTDILGVSCKHRSKGTQASLRYMPMWCKGKGGFPPALVRPSGAIPDIGTTPKGAIFCIRLHVKNSVLTSRKDGKLSKLLKSGYDLLLVGAVGDCRTPPGGGKAAGVIVPPRGVSPRLSTMRHLPSVAKRDGRILDAEAATQCRLAGTREKATCPKGVVRQCCVLAHG